MPEAMPSTGYLLAAVLISAAVTWSLRAVPFAFLHRLRERPIIAELALTLPVGIMAILVLHTVRDTDAAQISSAVPALVAIVLTAAVHWWRGNALLSIALGTGTYIGLLMLLQGA